MCACMKFKNNVSSNNAKHKNISISKRLILYTTKATFDLPPTNNKNKIKLDKKQMKISEDKTIGD